MPLKELKWSLSRMDKSELEKLNTMGRSALHFAARWDVKYFCFVVFFTAISVVKCFQFQVQQSWACGVFAWTWDGGWCCGGGRHDRSSLCFQVGLLISIVVVLYVWWFSHSRYARTEYIRVDLGGGCSASVKNSTQVHIQKQRCDLICDF